MLCCAQSLQSCPTLGDPMDRSSLASLSVGFPRARILEWVAKRFFDILIDKYAVEPEKTLFIGNDSRTDIGGAQSVNFDTFYVNSNISPENDTAETADYVVEVFTCWE